MILFCDRFDLPGRDIVLAAHFAYGLRAHRTLADLAPPAAPLGAPYTPFVTLHDHVDCCSSCAQVTTAVLTIDSDVMVLLFPSCFTCQDFLVFKVYFPPQYNLSILFLLSSACPHASVVLSLVFDSACQIRVNDLRLTVFPRRFPRHFLCPTCSRCAPTRLCTNII